MKEESLLLLSDLQKLINQVVLIDYTIIILGVDTLSKYYSIHEFSKIIGVSAQTLRNWDANGKLHPHHTTSS